MAKSPKNNRMGVIEKEIKEENFENLLEKPEVEEGEMQIQINKNIEKESESVEKLIYEDSIVIKEEESDFGDDSSDSEMDSYKLIIKKEPEKEIPIFNFQESESDDDETNSEDQRDPLAIDDEVEEDEDVSDFEDELEINKEKEETTSKYSFTTHFPENVDFRECKICNIKFKRQNFYFSHNFLKHDGPKYFSCGQCGESFGTFKKLEYHQKSVHDPKVTCSKCIKTMGERLLKKHLKEAHSDQILKCSFPGCGKMYTRPSALKRHEDYCHKSSQKYSCDKCDKDFYTENFLNDHKRVDHILKCIYPGCERIFKNRQKFSDHVEIHQSTQQYLCDKCDKVYATEAILKRHIYKAHVRSREKKFKCNLCNFATHKSELLKRHVARHASKNVSCDICCKIFRTKKDLNTHKKYIHEDLKFKCYKCNKSVANMSNLSKHIKSQH